MIIGNLLGIFRKLCFCFNVLAPLYVLNASNSAGADAVSKLYRSVHLDTVEEISSFHLDEERTEELRAFGSHKWPKVTKFEEGKEFEVELGNRMLFNRQIVESGNVFNHIERYEDKEEFFKLENRYSILNVLLGDDLAKLYIRLKRNDQFNYSDEELRSLADSYGERVSLITSVVTGSIFYKDANEFLQALKGCRSHYLATKRSILSDLDFILLDLKDMYKEKMHGIYKYLVHIKNFKNNLKKTEPFKIWKESSGDGEDSSTHTEVLVIYKILAGIDSSGSSGKKLIDLLPSEWTGEDKQRIANAIPAVLFSRKAMCATCETFMSCFFSYIFDGSVVSRSDDRTVFAYSIGVMSPDDDTSSKLVECRYEDRAELVEEGKDSEVASFVAPIGKTENIGNLSKDREVQYDRVRDSFTITIPNPGYKKSNHGSRTMERSSKK